MGALVDVPIQEVAQTVLKNQSAIDAVHADSVAAPETVQPSPMIPVLILLALGAFLL